MDTVVRFEDATDPAILGGKGANLASLHRAGFRVPSGFVISTEGYRSFVAAGEIEEQVAAILADLDDKDDDRIESAGRRIRELIVSTEMPAELGDAIRSHYRELGEGVRVAVRSSGSAEDLADASFAGMHDTYLHVYGIDGVLDAVRRCYASMWSDRAIAYRTRADFVHTELAMAVVVQEMVDADVAGVMFTANPVTTATDELLINASWGLGEAVVAAEVTPDQYILWASDLTVRSETIGSKKHRIVRAADGQPGTVVETVPEAERAIGCLSEEELRRLGDLGLRVQRHYGGFPQDTEWAIRDGIVYLLQARPITGVEFSWDAELDEVARQDIDARDAVWTRGFADSVATNAISPLMYSWRFAEDLNILGENVAELYGLDQFKSTRIFRFYKAELYYSVDFEIDIQHKTTLPALRPYMLDFSWIPPTMSDDFVAAPFSFAEFVRRMVRVVLNPERRILGTGALRILENWRVNRTADAFGLSYAELRELTDTELKLYVERQQAFHCEFANDIQWAFFIQWRDSIAAVAWMLTHWYTGGNPTIATDLMAGCETPSDTQLEHQELWQLAEQIRASALLRQVFDEHPGADFFTAAASIEGGEEFVRQYRAFIERWGHRGSEERDIIFPRRADDPGIDYGSLRVLLNAKDPVNPQIKDREINERREVALAELLDNLRGQVLGGPKVQIFRAIYEICHRFFLDRDNERANPNDPLVYSIRRGYVEMGRRMYERGQLTEARDVFFLGKHELFPIFDGTAPHTDLIAAKIAARKRDWERFYNKESMPPMYIQHGAPLALGRITDMLHGVVTGDPISGGIVTGTARVVKKLEEIGRVQPGEILIALSTDPGWTPVFLTIKGVVVANGGALSHAACLAREYGLPAVRIDDVFDWVPDGAQIEVDGTSGCVTVLDEARSALDQEVEVS